MIIEAAVLGLSIFASAVAFAVISRGGRASSSSRDDPREPAPPDPGRHVYPSFLSMLKEDVKGREPEMYAPEGLIEDIIRYKWPDGNVPYGDDNPHDRKFPEDEDA